MKMKTAILTALLCAVVWGTWAPEAAALEDELDHGLFKYMYTKETRRRFYDPINLDLLLQNPKHYLNSYVTIKCRFHRLEEDLAIPEFTPFSATTHLAFSVWDISTKLWKREEMTGDYPLFFVERGSDAEQKLLRSKTFDVILLYGKVETFFNNLPWFMVTNIKFLEKNELNLTLFTHIQFAEDLARKEQHDLAVEELTRTLDYDANTELKAMLYKRLGTSLFKINKYTEAAKAFENSFYHLKGDYEVYSLWGDSEMNRGKYRQAIKLYNLSLKYLGKQAEVYGKIGYCYAKVADEMIKQIRSGEAARKEKKPGEVRRREKQVRGEWAPPQTGQFARKRRALTLSLKSEIEALYNQGIRECRKALIVDPSLPDEDNHLEDVKSKKKQFIEWIDKEFAATEEAPPAGKSGKDAEK
jgi:tetratricopeptide (TPR) repeat protein